MTIPVFPISHPRSSVAQSTFHSDVAVPSSASALHFGSGEAPELGDWRELAYRHNARPVESLPREAYVWGAGIFGQALARRLADAGTVVRAFVDGKPELWGRKLRDGLVCIAPETLFARDPAPVAIGIHNYAVDLHDVIEPLSARAFDAWAPERLWRAAALAGHRWPAAFWLDHPFWGQCEATAALDGARQALELFADEASARVFWGELCARALGLAHLRARPEEGQYLPASLPRWPEPIRLIDAGAFTGDTVRAFLRGRMALSHAICFEPDLANFDALSSMHTSETELIALPLALAECAKQLRFSAGEGAGSRSSNDGAAVVQCVALDQMAPHFPATLLKMDIEGSELDALNGARTLIARSGCSMAISAYHEPDHLWRVPLLMHELAPELPLFLRAHAFNGFDTVAYALPAAARELLRRR